MAVINRNPLVLNNVSVARDVVTSTTGRGTNPASGKTLGIPFSRRLSQCYPLAEQKPGWRQDHADQSGAAHAANRAGRPGCSSRVVASLRSAHPADRTDAMRWFLATEMFCPPTASPLGRFTARRAAHAGRIFAGRLLASGVEALCGSKRLRLPLAEQARTPNEVNLAGFEPAGGASLASTRG
jgi:hypothetical protein